MAQRHATAVRHPLAIAESSTPPQLPLGDKNPRNDEELTLGDETLGTKEDPHPLASAATLMPPQIPLGGETPGNTTNSGQQASRTNLGATSSKENNNNDRGGRSSGRNENNDNDRGERSSG